MKYLLLFVIIIAVTVSLYIRLKEEPIGAESKADKIVSSKYSRSANLPDGFISEVNGDPEIQLMADNSGPKTPKSEQLGADSGAQVSVSQADVMQGIVEISYLLATGSIDIDAFFETSMDVASLFQFGLKPTKMEGGTAVYELISSDRDYLALRVGSSDESTAIQYAVSAKVPVPEGYISGYPEDRASSVKFEMSFLVGEDGSPDTFSAITQNMAHGSQDFHDLLLDLESSAPIGGTFVVTGDAARWRGITMMPVNLDDGPGWRSTIQPGAAVPGSLNDPRASRIQSMLARLSPGVN